MKMCKSTHALYLSQHEIFVLVVYWYLLEFQATGVQAGLRKRTNWPEPLLLAYTTDVYVVDVVEDSDQNLAGNISMDAFAHMR